MFIGKNKIIKLYIHTNILLSKFSFNFKIVSSFSVTKFVKVG